MAVTPVMILCRGHNNPLLKCKGMQKESEFYSSRSPLAYHPVELKNATSGKIHYCKTCVQKIFEYEFNKSNNMQKAVYYTCQRLDIPFIVDLFDEAILKSKGSTVAEVTQVGKKLMGEYIARLNTNKAKYGTKIDFSCSDTVLSEIDTSLEEKAKTKKELERFQLDWGLQEDEDYSFLEYRYSVYTDGTLMEKLKISNFNEQKDKSEIDKILERQIWEIENTEPCELVDKEEYKDFLDIGKNWGKHILRAIRNLIAGTKDYPDVTKDEWN